MLLNVTKDPLVKVDPSLHWQSDKGLHDQEKFSKQQLQRNRELNTEKLTLAMFKNRLHKDDQEERYVPKKSAA